MPNSWPLLERETELALIARYQDESRSGKGALLLLGGEAGIGKTALLEAITAGIHSHGRALWALGCCPGPDETPPYGPLLQVVRRLSSQRSLESASLPAPLGAAGGVRNPAESAAALVQWLGEAGEPVLFALEDIHWADPATLDLLRHLPGHLAQASVLVLATYCPEEVNRRHPLWTLLPTLKRNGAQEIFLRRLTPDGVAQLTAGVLGNRPDQEDLARRLYRRTGGLPLFVREMLKGFSQSENGRPTLLPATVQQIIDARLARLRPETTDALQAAAVLGEYFDWTVLKRMVDLSDDELTEVLEEAETAHIILAVDPEGHSFRFDYSLVREVLLSRLIGPRRARWHGRAAEALLERPLQDAEALAYHLSQAGDERAVGYLIAAGDRAYQIGALTQAERYYAQALTSMTANDRRRPELLLRYASFLRSGEQGAYLQRLEAASEAAEALCDEAVSHWTRRLVLTQASQEMLLCEYLARAEVMERQEEDLLRGPDADRFRSMGPMIPMAVLRAKRLAMGAQSEKARGLISALRSRALDGPAAAELTAAEAVLALQTGEFETAISLIVPLTGPNPSGAEALRALLRQYIKLYLVLLSRADHPAEVERVRQESLDLEARLLPRGGDSLLPPAYSLSGICDYLLGDWQRARIHLLKALTEASGERGDLIRLGAGALLLAQGQPSEALSILAPMVPSQPLTDLTAFHSPMVFHLFGLRAEAHLRVSEVQEASAWVETGERWLAQGEFRAWRSTVRLARANLLRQQGSLNSARSAAAEALGHASEVRNLWDMMAAQRLLGELRAALGTREEGIGHLQASLDLAERCRFPYEAALTRLAWGRVLGQGPGALELLEEARDCFARLGASPALEEANAALAARTGPDRGSEGVRNSKIPALPPDRLTTREIEIVRLVARGMSDKEVGWRLQISPRTVDGHLRNVYSKLGVSSRAALTAWAISQNIAQEHRPG